MAKRRTANVQRRPRASAEAMGRRLDAGRGSALDWRIVAIVAFLLVGLVAVVVAVLVSSTPNPWVGTTQPDDGRVHVTDGESVRDTQPGAYSTVPAASGPHWGTPANWGVYGSPPQESQLVHNLEHGGIVIWYDPERVGQEDVDTMGEFVLSQVRTGQGGRFRFVLAPWSGPELASPVVVAAWRQLLPLDGANMEAIRGFADANYGDAPENNGGPAPVANPEFP